MTTLPPSCADCLENWEAQLPGTFEASTGIALPVTHFVHLLKNNVIFFHL